MSEKFEHKKLSKQRSGSDYCELMSQFAPSLGQIAGPDPVLGFYKAQMPTKSTYDIRA